MHKNFRHYDWGGGIIQLNIFVFAIQTCQNADTIGDFRCTKNQGSTQRADPFLIY